MALNCLQCASGYHLEGGYCYRSLDGCISHFGYICLECEKFSILVENRCLSCREMGDLNKVVFYEGLWEWVGTSRQQVYSQSYLLGI